MNIYGIADLHLAVSTPDKSMEIFGSSWEKYMDKIIYNWNNMICEEDVVVIPGDISWAMRLEDSLEDMRFIDNLPGRKIIMKGNHDYWWATGNKMNNFLINNGLKTITYLQNSFFPVKELSTAICGSRGWKNPWDNGFNEEDLKIYNRELLRLEMSLSQASKEDAGNIIAALHFPPLAPDNYHLEDNEIIKLFEKYSVKKCIFGHIHIGNGKEKDKWSGFADGSVNINGINFQLVSSDMISFRPVRIV